ncbi:hypothetical protein HN695_06780 [Candidatus Woesearchaeota archaeon]|jgi:tRNA (guanine37-N1)-methyltransferase|nr:hypothetical protein [Candidatus Woesearchaeota archaeon]MBT5271934.1 hypothetical protein [Candidatus Woesearchaeota archaeon]MBT6041046.1 hypothetical protein [Candidatus Woesearchaeota archaeon]MBT6336222.1 hypothetical protein [Candidatus Woesearchaeota archaeon]MBT7928011.1 hypothetical protein [Candidatus Woesearchaeota archaeon]
MALCIKVPKKEANKVKIELIRNKNLNNKYKVISDKENIYFPINKEFKTKYKTTNKKLDSMKQEITSLKTALKKILTKKEIEMVKTAYDLVGDIAILEIDEELRKKEKDIAKALLKIRKDVKTVLRKQGSHEGVFRTQKMKYLAGEKKKIALHKENNIKLKLNVETVYFSPRLSTERKRITELVKKSKKKEDILIMFSGCSPYCCVLARNAKDKINSIIGIEINPEGHKYALENIKLNKLTNVGLNNGDVKKIVPKLVKLNKKYDRILMPLPKLAEDFLGEALAVSKKDTIIHFYNFLHEKEFEKAEQMIKKACVKAKKKYKILKFVKCGQHSPGTYRICLDFKIV